MVGIVVDSVSDVLELSASEIKPCPEVLAAIDSRFMTGLGKLRRAHADPAGHRGHDQSPDFGLVD